MFNVFDAIIVIVGFVDLFIAGRRTFIVLRCFRLFRLIKLVKSWKGLRVLLSVYWMSLPSLANIGLLIIVVIFIFALVGMQFFNGDRPLIDGKIPRYNFNTLS